MAKYTIKDLHDAGMEMVSRNLDFEDNIGSPDKCKFWAEFVVARNKYREIRGILRGKT